MRVETELTDDDLDDRFPDPDDGDGDEPVTGVLVVVGTADGARRAGTVHVDGDMAAPDVAEALVRCVFAVAALHSPACTAVVSRWLIEPAETKD